jgi:RND family efflux transporter MFP subunit
MNRTWIIATLTCLPLTFAGCNRSDAAENLPPATGSGAPAMPTLPTLASNSAGEGAAEDQVLRATGTTLALHQAELGPKMSGLLAAVLVDEGDKVKKGQPLFRLEATNMALGARQAEAGLAQAKVGLSQAELDYHRTKSLYEQGAVSASIWDQARIGYDRAQVAVQQASVAVSSARAVLGDTTVVAPFTGIVTSTRKNTGETVTMMPPTVILVIQDLSKIEVRVKVAENALNRIHPGEVMKVHFPSLNADRDIPIDRVNPSVDPLNRTVEIVGIIANDDRALKAGMLVEVTFPALSAASSAASMNSAPTSAPSAANTGAAKAAAPRASTTKAVPTTSTP